MDHPVKPRFIVFEGPDGSGKTSALERARAWLQKERVPVVTMREPGGTEIGEEIRRVLLNTPRGPDRMTPRTELLLFLASRAQLIAERIRPALKQRHVILCDRFNTSTFVYQGLAGVIPGSRVLEIMECVGTYTPDLTLTFTTDFETMMIRSSPLLDRMERKGEAYYRKVIDGYEEVLTNTPEILGPHERVDASMSPGAIDMRVQELIERELTG